MLELPENVRALKEEFEDIAYSLDERRIHLWCAAKARSYNGKYGRGVKARLIGPFSVLGLPAPVGVAKFPSHSNQ